MSEPSLDQVDYGEPEPWVAVFAPDIPQSMTIEECRRAHGFDREHELIASMTDEVSEVIGMRVLTELSKFGSHEQFAAEVFNVPADEVTPEMRARAKTVRFGITYGSSPEALRGSMQFTTSQVDALTRRFRKTFPGVAEMINSREVDS